ncbi:pyridoxamine 5'-phosphate oxidase family protein [Aeromicrobium sp.]|uniref:pyridoxamine 5'-phosphate oxidase family protein n=1 Tax=Aeromicrobium sp. TaxID=1871063 RepID=UPI003C448974
MTIPSEHPQASLVSIEDGECRELLTTTTVGHVAFVDDDGQQLIPVNFAYLDGAVYFRTEPGRVLSALARGHDDVAFGVDHHDVFRHGWNVTVKGPAGEVEDRATINKVLGHSRLRPWAGGTRPMVIRIGVDSIDGRRVSGTNP